MKVIKSLALMSLIAVIALLTASCATTKETNDGKNVKYIVAQHYFVNNSVNRPIKEKIDDEATFNKLFGMAAVMGKNGQPTAIDFSKQFVIAISDGVTNISTQYQPISLQKVDRRLVFTYKTEKGKEINFSINPLLLLVVDKKWESDVTFINKQ